MRDYDRENLLAHDAEEITATTFDDTDPSSPETLLRHLPLNQLCEIIDGTFEHVFGSEEITELDIVHVSKYLASGNPDQAHFAQFNERARRALVGRLRLYEMYAIYAALLKDIPDAGGIMERMIGHAFYSGIQVATGCERTIDYVRKSTLHDDQRQKQSAAAWETSRKRTEWKREARDLYTQVVADSPDLKTATQIVARMNEVRRIRGSSPEQLLALVRRLRSQDKNSSRSLPNSI